MAAKTRRTYAGAAVSTTLAAGINSTDTTISLTAATGWAAGPFYVVIDPGTASEEKIYVSSRSTTTLTVGSRGVDGTTAKAHSSGAVIYPVHAAVDSDEANELTSTYTTRGDIVYQGASTFTRLGVGTADQVLKTNGTDPSWGQVATAGIADDAVTAAKIAAGAVGASEIADGSVGTAEISTAIAGNGLSGGGGSALAVNVDDTTIEINSDSLRVKNGGITRAKLESSVSPGLVHISSTGISNATSQTISNVFTDTYYSYKIVISNLRPTSGTATLSMKLAAGGTPDSSAEYGYAYWYVGVPSTPEGAQQQGGQSSWVFTDIHSGKKQFVEIELAGPQKADDTVGVYRMVSGSSTSYGHQNGTIYNTENTSFDGLTIIGSSAISCSVDIYGYYS